DSAAGQVLTQAGEALGVTVATLAMILNIDLYVVGGSVAKSGDLLLEPARRTVPRYAFESVAASVNIVATNLWADGAILGAGWLARQAINPSL
ncbi:MAG: ROK family protein, partial [Chloroflexi bacterium]